VDRHGLPASHYFIWFDDVEYTARILRDERGYFVAGSVAVHKTQERYSTATSKGDRFFYAVRNRLYMLRGHSWTAVEKLRIARMLAKDIRAYLAHNGYSARAARTVARGFVQGLISRQV
jgi:GT2 family glycosyltransferase